MGKKYTVETAFKAGKDAHGRGVLRALGPHRKGSPDYDDWVRGWDAALRASRGDPSRLNERPDILTLRDARLQSVNMEDFNILGDRPPARAR
jgi:hypothetical protein